MSISREEPEAGTRQRAEALARHAGLGVGRLDEFDVHLCHRLVVQLDLDHRLGERTLGKPTVRMCGHVMVMPIAAWCSTSSNLTPFMVGVVWRSNNVERVRTPRPPS